MVHPILLAAALASGAGSDTLGSADFRRAPVQLTVGPPAPTLADPPADATLDGGRVTFRWRPGGEAAVSTYRVCLAEQAADCTGLRGWRQPGSNQPPLTDTTLTADLPARLYQGKRLFWSVAACVSDPGRPTLGGGVPESCTWAPPRSIRWALPPPTLGQPADGTELTGLRPPLRLRAAVPGADSYLFCISRPGIACPLHRTEGSDTVVVQVREPFSDPSAPSWIPGHDLNQFAGATVHWTAGACNGLIGCVYQEEVRELTFPGLPATVYVRNASQYDINEVWLVHAAGPGVPPIREELVRDLSRWRNPTSVSPGASYDSEIAARIPKRHDVTNERGVTPYYVLEYRQEQAGGLGGVSALPYVERTSVRFAPGITHVKGFTLVRETIFLFDYNGAPPSRHEQVLRGADGQLYVYLPGGAFPGHPEVLHGPILLSTLVGEGYRAYAGVDLEGGR